MRYLIFILFFVWGCPLYAEKQTITLIAHPSVSLQSKKLSLRDIRNIYLLKKRQWTEAGSIIVVNRKSNSAVRQLFESKIKLSSNKYALYLRKMHYKGITLPVIQESKTAVIAFVSQVPGAIAYVEGVVPTNAGVQIVGMLP